MKTNNNSSPDSSDEWETPQWLFEELDREFKISYDLCASSNNKKTALWCKDYLNARGDWIAPYLGHSHPHSAFMNPPYSNPLPFVKKAWDDSKYMKIVVLLKCDTSTKTWEVFWDYELNTAKPGASIRFLPKRLKFEYLGLPGKHAANFPSVIVIMDRRGL